MSSRWHSIERRNIALFLILFLTLFVEGRFTWKPVVVKATSATLTFSTKSREVQIGDTFSVVVYLDANDSIGSFEAFLAYDEETAEFVKGGSYVSGGEGLLKISDMDSEDLGTTKKYSINFKALKKGTCNFGTSEAPKVYNASGEELSISSNRLSVSVLSSTKLSSNSNLKSLKISPGSLSPEYSNDVTEYKTEVPNDSDMLFVAAEAEDSDAVVTVEGNENLSEGTNFVHVMITSESGEQKDIQIEVKRLYANEETENQVTEDPENDNQEELADGVTVSKEGKTVTIMSTVSYTVMDLKSDAQIPGGYEKSEIKIGSENITAYINSKNPQSEFVLLYLKNGDNETGFYQYDRVEKTIQRYSSNTLVNTPEDTAAVKESNTDRQVTSQLVMIVILGSIIIILSIILGAVLIHRKSSDEKRMDE